MTDRIEAIRARHTARLLERPVKRSRCTSLKEFEGGNLKRCMMDAGHEKAYAKHCTPADHSPRVGVEWATDDEAGRITERDS